ncbi:hypothetical protein NQU44_26125, partial [Escherichia coli]|nr:hypothetical protein [Escherichia coli]
MKINAIKNFLREQKVSLEQLNAKTWGVRYREESNGRFLVLPKGMKAETNRTKDNGKLIAVRLVQECQSMTELERHMLNALER